MSLKLNMEDDSIHYHGLEVGSVRTEGTKKVVTLNIEYTVEDHEEWFVPICWFAAGLATLAENQPPPVLLTIESGEDVIAEEYDVARGLIEKTIKQQGYVWKFHKSDADNWPSELHGHDYDKGMKLDVLSGDIYDVLSRNRCKTLKRTELLRIQDELRKSKDFKTKIEKFIDS